MLTIPIGQSPQRRPTCLQKRGHPLVFLASERARANQPGRDLSPIVGFSKANVLQNENTIPSYAAYARWFVGDR